MVSNTPEPAYSDKLVDLIELVYGKGFLSQGGIESVDFMFKDIDLNDKKILDLGSGLGGIDFYLAQKYTVDIVGVDIDSSVIKKAEQQLEKIKPTLKGNVAFALEGASDYLQQFDNETFDIIFSKETILHIPTKDKVKYFEQVYRILKKDGAIIIMDWMHTSPDYSKELQNMIEADDIPYNLVTPEEYMEILEAANFKNINFINTIEQTILLNKKDCEKIIESQDVITQKFGRETYEEALASWTAQLNAFKKKELISGIFKASK